MANRDGVGDDRERIEAELERTNAVAPAADHDFDSAQLGRPRRDLHVVDGEAVELRAKFVERELALHAGARDVDESHQQYQQHAGQDHVTASQVARLRPASQGLDTRVRHKPCAPHPPRF